MALLSIAGGVALILFGIRFLRQGLERVSGHGLHAWIERMSPRPGSAAVAGLAFGAVAPSSTAQTLLTMQLLNAGKLPAERMLLFLLGANVGITVTVQLIAFRFFDYYALLLLAGLAGYQFSRSETTRGAGQALLGLGFIFMAMGVISAAARVLTAEPDFETVLAVFANHRWLLVVFAAGLTFATQSSTATIGLALAFGEAGACGLQALVPVVLGANLGLGLTSLAAGWPTLAGRRLASANLLLKCAVLLPCLWLFAPLLAWLDPLSGGLARQTANFHTAFNLIVAVAGAALGGVVGRLVVRTVRERPGENGLGGVPTHLDPAALSSPVFALANAARETLRLADEVKTMLAGCWRAYQTGDVALVRQVQQHDDRVDDLHAAIKHYLSQIPADAMTPRDSQLQFGLLHFASQLETVADIIDKSLGHQALKQIQDTLPLSMEDKAALAEMHQRVMRRFEMAISVLAARDHGLARKFLHEGDALKEWCLEAEKRHYQRLKGDDPRVLEASAHFLDMLNSLRRISGQINTIGHTFAKEKPKE